MEGPVLPSPLMDSCYLVVTKQQLVQVGEIGEDVLLKERQLVVLQVPARERMLFKLGLCDILTKLSR